MAVKKTKAKTRLSAKVARKKASPVAAVKRHFRETPAAQVVENMESLLPPGHQGLLPVARPEPVQVQVVEPIEPVQPVESDRERRIRLATASKAPRAVTETDTQVAEKDFDFGA